MFTLPEHRALRLLAVLFAVLILWPGAATPAKAAGVTTHWFMGVVALKELKPDLRNLLIKHSTWYRRGTTFPDAAIGQLVDKNASDADQDDYSHNVMTKHHKAAEDGGFFTKYLDQVLERCGKDLEKALINNTNHCADTLAFFFGMVAHVISDAPWHNDYIAKTSGKFCPKVDQEWGGHEYRHGIADTDFDICLASRLRGSKKDITNIVAFSRLMPTNHKPSVNKAAPCGKGQFFNIAKGGKCFKCPSGYSTTGALADSSDACAKTSYKKGNKHGVPTPLCPKGQWLSVHDGHCYTCDSGYSHNSALTGNDPKVCHKTSHKKAEDKGLPSLLCSNDELYIAGFTKCWKCPSGFEMNQTEQPDSAKKCEQKVTAPCSVLKVPDLGFHVDVIVTADLIAAAALPANKEIIGLMNKAYKDDGHKVDAAGIDKHMNKLYGKALAEPLVTFSDIVSRHKDNSDGKYGALTKYAGSCEGLFKHGLDGNGGDAMESGKLAGKAMAAIWQGITTGKPVKLVRTDSFNYRVTVDDKRIFCYGGC